MYPEAGWVWRPISPLDVLKITYCNKRSCFSRTPHCYLGRLSACSLGVSQGFGRVYTRIFRPHPLGESPASVYNLSPTAQFPVSLPTTLDVVCYHLKPIRLQRFSRGFEGVRHTVRQKIHKLIIIPSCWVNFLVVSASFCSFSDL